MYLVQRPSVFERPSQSPLVNLWRGPHNEREYTRDKIPQADFGNPGYQKLNKENKSRLQSIFHLLQDMFDCFQAVTDHVFLI